MNSAHPAAGYLVEKLGEAGTTGKKAGLQRLDRQIVEVRVEHKSASFLKWDLQRLTRSPKIGHTEFD
jgi:hypothetical protein